VCSVESTDERLEALERENAALRHAIVLLHEVSNLLHGSLEVEAACYAVLTGVTAGVGLGFNRAMLFEVDRADPTRLVGMMAVGPADEVEADRVWRAIERGQDSLPALYQSGLAARDAHAPLDRQVRALKLDDASVLSTALREGRLVETTEADDDLDGLLHLSTGIAAPLKGVNGTLGVLYADNRFTERKCSAEVAQIFALVADHAGRAVENARRFEREAKAARADALTGLGHHGALMERLTGAVADARANEHPLSLVMIDLDNFKGVNDHFGHLAGDELLAALAARLKARTLRTGSMAFRYGRRGVHPAFCPASTPRHREAAIAERVRLAVADEPFIIGRHATLQVTCSLGVVGALTGHDRARLRRRS
jgi:diguanylate cyclase (GGDEF)-like protein